MFSQKLLLASILIVNRTHLRLTFLYKNFLLKRMFTYLGSRFFHSQFVELFRLESGKVMRWTDLFLAADAEARSAVMPRTTGLFHCR